jgi:hypothetical protein
MKPAEVLQNKRSSNIFFLGSILFSAFFPACKFLFKLTWMGLLTLVNIF